jgi:F-type H+-transporting ATPase subunit gamma
LETLERLARRIEAVEDLQSVVRTMKTLSAVGVRRFLAASRAVRSYDAVVDLGLRAALHGAALEWPDRGGAPPEGPRMLFALGADHGLCGRFDEDVAARAAAEAAAPPRATLVAAVGLRAADRLRAAGLPPETVRPAPGSVAGLSEAAGALLVTLDGWRRAHGAEEALLIHNVETGDAPARVAALRLLPVSRAWLEERAAAEWPGRGLPMRADARDAILSRLIRQHLFVRVYRALAESLASEHAARLAVMQGAERNIADHLADMGARFRARRQEAITTELLEVSAGYDALREESERS